MFPDLAITGGDLDAQLLYLSLVGVLLFIGSMIRLHVPILRKYHIPAALVGGFIGLLLGPSVLGIIPQAVMTNWSNLSGRLIVIVLAPMFIGVKKFFQKGDFKLFLGSACAYNIIGSFEYAIPLLLSALILEPVFGVSKYFGCIVEEGWLGGHGTAAGMAAVYEQVGYAEGQTLATTSATIGLLFGVIGGVILVNIAIRKRYTKYVKEEGKLVADQTELYLEDPPVDTHKTISSDVAGSGAFHAAILSIAVFIGYFMNTFIYKYLGLYISWFVCALVGGVFVNAVLNKTKYANMVDKATLTSISGIALDFLVTGAMASLNLAVIVSNIVPLTILMVTTAILMVVYVFVFCRRVLFDDWFENAIFNFGSGTGVAATGYLLLRVCDPQYRSNVMKRSALITPVSIFFGFGGGYMTSLVPSFVERWGSLYVGLAFLALTIAFILIPALFKVWKKAEPYPDQGRK